MGVAAIDVETTTISILTTTLAATSGSVQIAGADLAHDQSEVRRRVGIIFQKPSLDRALTGEENCRFHAALYGAYAYRPSFSLMPQEYRDRVVELGAATQAFVTQVRAWVWFAGHGCRGRARGRRGRRLGLRRIGPSARPTQLPRHRTGGSVASPHRTA